MGTEGTSQPRRKRGSQQYQVSEDDSDDEKHEPSGKHIRSAWRSESARAKKAEKALALLQKQLEERRFRALEDMAQDYLN